MSNELALLAGRRILVLEDEYVIASEVEHCLRKAGADVEGPWPTAAQALAALNQPGNLIDAGVLDINLGHGGTAYPVAARLDSLGVPFLFTTGNTLSEAEPASQDHPRLEKPVSARALLKAVQELLAGQSNQQ